MYEGKNIVIGTHGTALMKLIMPWIVKMQVKKDRCINITKIDILNGGRSL